MTTCDKCGVKGDIYTDIRQTVCGGPKLCSRCIWTHRDQCPTCGAYYEEDEAQLRATRYAHKHPDRG